MSRLLAGVGCSSNATLAGVAIYENLNGIAVKRTKEVVNGVAQRGGPSSLSARNENDEYHAARAHFRARGVLRHIVPPAPRPVTVTNEYSLA
jgi:hypothetical protein